MSGESWLAIKDLYATIPGSQDWVYSVPFLLRIFVSHVGCSFLSNGGCLVVVWYLLLRLLLARHSVFQTDALPTELPRQLSWQGPNTTCT